MSRKREVLSSKGIIESQTFTCPELREALVRQAEAIGETDARVRAFIKKARPVRLDELVGRELKAFRMRVVERLKDKGWLNKQIAELLEISPQVIQREVSKAEEVRRQKWAFDTWTAALRLLQYSYKAVGHNYSALTPEERELVTAEEFKSIVDWIKEEEAHEQQAVSG